MHTRQGGRSARSLVRRGFQLGHSSVCDVRLPKPAPRKAALVVRCSDCYQLWNVCDDPSQVLLNGEAVPDQAVLQHGDRITAYGVEVRFELEKT